MQPAVIASDNVLITSQEAGIRRLALTNNSGAWSVAEQWTPNGLKPYFNDFVIHKGHAFGFDGRILSCIDLSDGQRKWKGGRYGHGQVMLASGHLVVVTEDGDLALVRATPERHAEVARLPILDGKTWNHPAIADGYLLVRNTTEMAALDLRVAR